MVPMIIGITGKAGAGKGVVVDYLVQQKGFKHFSARGFIVEEIEKRGLSVDRENMIAVANDLRAKHSPSYIIESLYAQALERGGDAVIESIRTPGEVEALKGAQDFCLFAIDAPVDMRYERIKARRSETDFVTFEKFKAEDDLESFSTDPTKQNVSVCITMADFVFKNFGTVEELYEKVDKVL